MHDVKDNNWLKPFREKAGFLTRSPFALAMNVDEKTIYRWETYRTSNNIPYSRIGKTVNSAAEDLRKAHKEGLAMHKLTQEKASQVNTSLILSALNACSTNIRDAILDKVDGNEVELASSQLAQLIGNGDINGIRKIINQPLKNIIASTADQNELGQVEQVVIAIAKAAVISCELKSGKEQLLQGAQRPWALRLMIDVSEGIDKSIIRAANELLLDDDITRSVKLPEFTKSNNPWDRVREVIKNISKEAFASREFWTCPGLNADDDHSSMRTHCEALNIRIAETNYENQHCFAHALHNEPQTIRDKVLELLPALRLLVCKAGMAASPVLRIDEKHLESWLANLCDAIQKRQVELVSQIATPKLDNEEIPMPKNYVGRDSITNHYHGGVTASAVSGRDAKVTNNQSNAELLQVLQQILEQTSRENSKQRQLRADVQEIIKTHEDTGKFPSNAKTWLETTKAYLNVGDSLFGLINKAIELFSVIS